MIRLFSAPARPLMNRFSFPSLSLALGLTVSTFALVGTPAQEFADGTFPVRSNLSAGVAKVDITPAETDGIEVTGHRRTVHGVRDPLRAGVLVLDDGETKAAIITLDTIGPYSRIGADCISVGAITNSAPVLDIGLDITPGEGTP